MRVHFSALPLAMLIGSMCAASCSNSTAQTDGGMAGSGTSTGGGDGGDDVVVPTGPYDGGDPNTLMTPKVSFQTDVMQIFTHSCDFSGCHINSLGMPLEYLGDSGYGTMPPPYPFSMAVYMNIYNKPTVEDPSLMFVKPGDPTNSYLLRKIDNGTNDITCVAGNALSMMAGANGMACGGPMPASGTMLAPAQIDTIRRWIAQGANYN